MVTGDETNALAFLSPTSASRAASYLLNKTAGKAKAQPLPIQSAQISIDTNVKFTVVTNTSLTSIPNDCLWLPSFCVQPTD